MTPDRHGLAGILQEWRAALEDAGFDVEPDDGALTARRDRAATVETVAVDAAAVLLVSATRVGQPISAEDRLAGSRLTVVAETTRTLSIRWERADGIAAAAALASLLERAANRRFRG